MSETVQVLEYRFGHFPAQIKPSGSEQIIEIEAVERCWTELPGCRGGPKYHEMIRYFTAARRGSDLYQLSQDIGIETWSVQPEA